MPTILIIDEDVALVSNLSRQAEAVGYRVLRANDLAVGERIALEERPDLVLLDPQAAHGTGWDLLGRIATQLPVMVVSALIDEQAAVTAIERGAVDFLAKPVRVPELLARLRLRLRPNPVSPSTGGTTPLRPPKRRNSRRPVRASDTLGEDGEEQVFISPNEEQGLIAATEPEQPVSFAPVALAQLTLAQRLHSARQQRRITLVQAELELKTRVRMHHIQAMEDGKFGLLPRGPAGEEIVRSYAAYLGLDVAQAVSEFRRDHYNEIVLPLPTLGGRPQPRRIRRETWRALIAGLVLLLLLGGGYLLRGPLGALASRAYTVVVPPTATSTSTPAPTATFAPTSTPAPTATLLPSSTPLPTDTATPAPTDGATAVPATAAPVRPTQRPPTAVPPTPVPPTAEPPTPVPPTAEPQPTLTPEPLQPSPTP